MYSLGYATNRNSFFVFFKEKYMKSNKKIFIAGFIQAAFLMQFMLCKAHTSAEVMATMGLPYIAAYYKEIAEKTAAAGIGLAGLTFGLWLDKKVEELIDKSTQEDVRLIKEVRERLRIEAAEELQSLKGEMNKVSQAIDERITQLLNEEFIPQFELFCTIKSKIFVLQNIEDFFEFNDDEQHKFFNSLVYEVCIKKINELEVAYAKEMQKVDKEEKGDFLHVEIAIDNARSDYIAKYGILVEQLKGMTIELIDEITDAIIQEMDRLRKDKIEKNAPQNNINSLALISILGHLEYVKRHKLKEVGGEHGLVKIVEKSEPHMETMRKAIAAKEAMQQKLRAQFQPSLFSKIRAYFASLWYGNK